MEQHAVVVAVTRVRDEILDCLGALVREELQVDLNIGGGEVSGRAWGSAKALGRATNRKRVRGLGVVSWIPALPLYG
eukprot:scaffold28815_cov51-Isochrysis_galbana.AAC.1